MAVLLFTYFSLIAYFFAMDTHSGTSNKVLFERWAKEHSVDPDHYVEGEAGRPVGESVLPLKGGSHQL